MKKTKLKKPAATKPEKVAKKTRVVSDETRGRHKKITAEDKQVALSLAEDGFTEKQIADRLGVDRTTIWRLKQSDDKFCNALKTAKKAACETVERSLYELSVGYSCPETKVIVANGNIHKITVTKHYPPSPDAIKFYLKNRDPDRWKDKLEQDIVSDGKSMAELIQLASQARSKKRG